MSKYTDLRKTTLKTALMFAGAVLTTSLVYLGLSLVEGSVNEQKTSAESKFNADSGLLAALRDQMNKSGEAEKSYAAIQESRVSKSYETDLKTLRDYLSGARERFKLSDLKMKSVTSEISDKPELANFTHNIQVWNRFRITFKAVSDVHVFSFLEDLRSATPGFVRVDALEIKRVSDFTDQSLSAIRISGAMPLNVEAKIEFSWIGLSPKNKTPTPTPRAP